MLSGVMEHFGLSKSLNPVGIVKLTVPLAPLPSRVSYSPYEQTIRVQPL